MNEAWFGYAKPNPEHYDSARYRAINLNNVWRTGTVEFRLFNGTTHAEEVKAHIQLCLAGFAERLEHEIPEELTVFNLVPDSIGGRRKLRTTNMIEFQNKELKKRTRCIKLFPNRESLLRIATALLIELDETWLSESKRYI